MNTQAIPFDPAALTASHLDAHKTNGQDWPADATFALVTRYSAWPLGWSKTKHVNFFVDRAGLDAAVLEAHRYASLEDNYVAYQGYEWNLGPTPMQDVEYNTGNL